MSDYMVSANEALDLLDGYEALKSSPECSGACARAAAPDLAQTVVALHARLAAVEAERDGALAHAEELTQALRETQRERDALRAIIEGRTTPPTTEELAAHGAVGGAWIVSGPFPALPMVCGPAETVVVIEEAARSLAPGALRWRAVNAHGRPCAWPGVSRG